MDDQLNKPVRLHELKSAILRSAQQLPAKQPAPSSIYDLPLCDEGQLRQLNGLGPVGESEEVISELVQLFVDAAWGLVSRLPELAANPERLVSVAHGLSGAAGQIGAVRAAHVCGTVEEAAKVSSGRLDHQTIADLRETLIASINEYRMRSKQKGSDADAEIA